MTITGLAALIDARICASVRALFWSEKAGEPAMRAQFAAAIAWGKSKPLFGSGVPIYSFIISVWLFDVPVVILMAAAMHHPFCACGSIWPSGIAEIFSNTHWSFWEALYACWMHLIDDVEAFSATRA